jgi:hypothetical protein
VRFVIAVSDPWWALRFFSWRWHSVTISLTLPITFSCTVLMTLLWYKCPFLIDQFRFRILSKLESKKLSPGIRGLFNTKTIVFGVSLIIFLVSLEFATDIARTIDYNPNQELAVVATGIIYFLLSIIMSGILKH